MKHSKKVKKLEQRQRDYDTMMHDHRCIAAMSNRERGYHRPGGIK